MKKIITTILSFIATQAIILAGQLDGTWKNIDSSNKNRQVVITSTPEEGTRFVLHFGSSRILEDSKLTMLGETVGEKSPDTAGHLLVDAKFADKTYIVHRKGENLVVTYITIFKDGSQRTNLREVHIFKK